MFLLSILPQGYDPVGVALLCLLPLIVVLGLLVFWAEVWFLTRLLRR